MSGWWSSDTTMARGLEQNQTQSALINSGGGGGLQPFDTPGGGWEPWGTPGGGGGESEVLPRGGTVNNSSVSSSSAMVSDLTVADENVLQCRICFLPLQPPIFQCVVGHTLCSLCSNKLKNARKCHLCRVAMPGGYQRCHAMEDVVNSIRVPCPHALYGCDKRPMYHAREEHLLECPHAPCHCPGNGCSFVGPVATLIKHLKAAHGWSCTPEIYDGASIGIYLREGFNFLTAVRGSTEYLFLLNMVSTPFGHAISAVWIRSPTAIAISSSTSATSTTTCDLDLYFMQFKHVKLQREHYERSLFQVEGLCPSNGLPNPNTSFQFFIPKYGGGTESSEARVYVVAGISIHSS